MCFWRVAFSVNVLSQRLHLNVWPPWIDHMWGWRLPLHLVLKSQIGHENASTIILYCLHAEEQTSFSFHRMQYQYVSKVPLRVRLWTQIYSSHSQEFMVLWIFSVMEWPVSALLNIRMNSSPHIHLISIEFQYVCSSICSVTDPDVCMCRSCRAMGREGEGFPAWNHLLGYVSHVLLSFVPTANFIVYCLVGNKFRSAVGCLYTDWGYFGKLNGTWLHQQLLTYSNFAIIPIELVECRIFAYSNVSDKKICLYLL